MRLCANENNIIDRLDDVHHSTFVSFEVRWGFKMIISEGVCDGVGDERFDDDPLRACGVVYVGGWRRE